MPHKVTTRDLQEAKETGKIYLSSMFYTTINQVRLHDKSVRRCKYCNNVLPPINYTYFCDDICKDEYAVQISKENLSKHICKYCDNTILPTLRIKDGKEYSSGVYKKICSTCKEERKKTKNKRDIERSRINRLKKKYEV